MYGYKFLNWIVKHKKISGTFPLYEPAHARKQLFKKFVKYGLTQCSVCMLKNLTPTYWTNYYWNYHLIETYDSQISLFIYWPWRGLLIYQLTKVFWSHSRHTVVLSWNCHFLTFWWYCEQYKSNMKTMLSSTSLIALVLIYLTSSSLGSFSFPNCDDLIDPDTVESFCALCKTSRLQQQCGIQCQEKGCMVSILISQLFKKSFINFYSLLKVKLQK